MQRMRGFWRRAGLALGFFILGWIASATAIAASGDVATIANRIAAWFEGAAGLVAVGALVGGTAGYLGTTRAARIAAEESRRNRSETSLARAEARDDEREARFADQKRALYTDLWIECDRHRREVENQVHWRSAAVSGWDVGDDPGIGTTERARSAYLAVALLAESEVVEAAEALYEATVHLGSVHRYVRWEDEPMEAANEVEFREDVAAWGRAAERFQSQASRDLQGRQSRSTP